MSDTIEKPVYSASTFGSPVNETPAVATAPATTAAPIETTNTTVDTSGQLQTTPAPTQETATTVQAPAPTETAPVNFTFEFEDQKPQEATTTVAPSQATAAQNATDWKEVIKNIDRGELLKAVGVDDFTIELDAHRRNGGDAADYLSAKAFDWNKVSDVDVVKNDLQLQFPTFSAEEINILYNRKYGVSETADDDEKTGRLLELKADAHTKRQAKIQEQSKFKIPAPVQVQQTAVATQSPEQIQAAAQQQLESAIKYVSEHEAMQSLMTSKRVALNLGENGTFNFAVERPDIIARAIADPVVWGQLTLNKQGEPDFAKMSKLAMYALNPEMFESSLVNYGRTLGVKTLVEEGQNATRTSRQLPGQNIATEQEAWKNPKQSTIGGRQ